MIEWLSTLQLPIELNQMIMVWAGILFASLLRSLTGFGFALAAVPIFSLFLSPVQSVVLCAALSVGIGIVTLPTYWNKNCFKPLAPLLIMTLIGTPLGAFGLMNLPLGYFQLGIGFSVIISCTILVFCRPVKFGLPKTRPITGSITGLVSGLLNGAFSIPGPPVIIYVMLTESDPMRSRSLMITFFPLSSALALTTYMLHGFITLQSIFLFLFSFPIMYLGDRLGFLMLSVFGTTIYRKISLLTLFLIGIVQMAQGLLV